MSIRVFGLLAALVGSLSISCSSADPSAADGDGVSSSSALSVAPSFVEASHGPLPQVTFHGGSVVATPHLLTVTFADYPYTPSLQSWAKWLPTSGWLAAWGAQYGVTSLNAGTATVIPTAPPVTDVSNYDVQPYLLQLIADKTLPVPRNGDVYAVYFPAQTGCNEGGGHAQLQYPGVTADYLIMFDCSESTTVQASVLESLESAASHELAEATTDDYQGWRTDDPLVNGVAGGEIADLCSFFDTTTNGHTFQRIWSNKAAAAGTNPCVPVPSDDRTFFQVTTPDRIQQVPSAPTAQTYTFPITGWSTAAISPWTIAAYTLSGESSFDPAPALSAGSIDNGETVALSMTVPAGAASGSQGVACVWSTAIGWRYYCVELAVQ